MSTQVRRVVTLAVAAFVSMPARAQPAVSIDDVAVFNAILRHTIRPEVAHMISRAPTTDLPPVVAFDHTLAFCGANVPVQREMGCFEEEHLQLRVFENALSAAARDELVASFRQRNAQREPIPAGAVDGLILTAPDQLQATVAREAGRTHGHAAFSLPAYTRDGRALAYATYRCGNVCGYGWLFLLERRGAEWRVVSAVMLWIS